MLIFILPINFTDFIFCRLFFRLSTLLFTSIIQFYGKLQWQKQCCHWWIKIKLMWIVARTHQLLCESYQHFTKVTAYRNDWYSEEISYLAFMFRFFEPSYLIHCRRCENAACIYCMCHFWVDYLKLRKKNGNMKFPVAKHSP